LREDPKVVKQVLISLKIKKIEGADRERVSLHVPMLKNAITVDGKRTPRPFGLRRAERHGVPGLAAAVTLEFFLCPSVCVGPVHYDSDHLI
jgi:hypothetical protein